MSKLPFFILLLPYLSFCQPSNTSINSRKIYPDSVWQFADDVTMEGWNKESLNNLKRFVTDSTSATGMVVIQSGKILFDYGDIKETSYLASCRKSVLSMLYGPFVANKKIDLSATMEQLHIDDVGGLLPIEKKATIRD